MPLVTLKEVLKEAARGGYAVGSFNVINVETLEAIISAAAEQESPVILAYAPVHRKFVALETIAPLMLKSAR